MAVPAYGAGSLGYQHSILQQESVFGLHKSSDLATQGPSAQHTHDGRPPEPSRYHPIGLAIIMQR